MTAVRQDSLHTSPTTRSQVAAAALRFAHALGVRLEPLLSRFALAEDAASAPFVTLPIGALRALMDALAEAADDPLFGIHLAVSARRTDYGIYPLLEYIARNAPTRRRYLECIARYNVLGNDVLTFELRQEGPNAVFVMSIPGEPLCLGRHLNECVELMIVDRLRAQSAPLSVERVVLAHEAHPHGPAVAHALRAKEVVFGRGANAIVVPAANLDEPLPAHDPRLFQLLSDHAELLLSRRSGKTRLLSEVRQAIWNSMAEELPTLESTARALHTSTRSLQRRLCVERATFHELLDSVREELARTLLEDPRRAIGEVADRLHYSDSSTFVRAFKRWTGMAPTEFRAAQPLRRSITPPSSEARS